MMSLPLVSAIMPTFNSARSLASAIQSICNQSYTNWELIIVNDGSTDATRKVIESFTDSRIRAIHLDRNVGRGAARNICIEYARGEFVAICDSDDISLKDRFSKQVQFLLTHPEIGGVASQLLYVREDSGPQLRISYPETPEAIARRLDQRRMAVPNASSMLRASLFQDYGRYCVECRRSQDLELFLRMHPQVRFTVLPEPLVLYNDDTVDLGLREWWRRTAYYHYAVHHAESCKELSEPRTFSQFARTWNNWLRTYGIGTMKFTRYKLLERLQPERRLV